MKYEVGDIVVLGANSNMHDEHDKPWIDRKAVVIDPSSDSTVEAFYVEGSNLAIRMVEPRPDGYGNAPLVWPIAALRHAVEITEKDVQEAIESIKRSAQ